ncbi:hypothetical protein A2690_04270 [Candidatus Roizmanbacteria bacterium RIFCSPHIGHO2_01_FULL_39_12b]|uniref:PsbP C-terminal domain-containing protein n=1 Tax=Candidatus Roizmanbacteria bacterium RIFCSPHIGHO2_01_FULL_39_12b TaxID=1802030 RepID=A0A1F7GCA7_9BACT|nr:MAG: hypothetical protein A2690_04270 [Candidatus Roizmanbacteria bacterium RIFCSPHIGHO2_01_FULL_39_12b]OGK47156.1 MAG: hypothetical protein A3B46_01995 [Candidatus Roizmanbacteria bacterium RIFCSPLOWO2_01_FULL_39_19]
MEPTNQTPVQQTPTQNVVSLPAQPQFNWYKIATFGLLFIIIVGTGTFWVGRKSQNSNNTNFPSFNSTISIAPSSPSQKYQDWQIYTSSDNLFFLSYPPDVTIQKLDDGTISFTKWGPTQRAETELYDGISVSFNVIDNSDGKSLREIAAEELEATKMLWGNDVIIEPGIVDININGIVGYVYKTNNGSATYILSLSSSKVLKVHNYTHDPTSQGFTAIAEKIIYSIKFN